MRARDRDASEGAGAAHGIERGVVGIGDALVRPPATVDEAAIAAAAEHGAKAGRMVCGFAEVPDGAFVWTRVADGTYRLGRLAGGWRYDDSRQAEEVGIHHVRPTRWMDRPFGDDEVPTGVADAFARGGRNFQRVHDSAAEARTTQLWSTAGEG